MRKYLALFIIVFFASGCAHLDKDCSSNFSRMHIEEEQSEYLVVHDTGDSRGFEQLIAAYTEVLEMPFDYCESDVFFIEFDSVDGGPLQDINKYKYILWNCGQRGTLHDLEIGLLKDYMDNEGSLFISGSNIGTSLVKTAEGRDFYNLYLKSADNTSSSKLKVKENSLVGAEDQEFFKNISARFEWKGQRASVLEPYGGSDSMLLYGRDDNAPAAAVGFIGTYSGEQASSRMLYMEVPWECISTSQQRTKVMEAVLDFLSKSAQIRYISAITGQVKDAETGEILKDATVILPGSKNFLNMPTTMKTKSNGLFRMLLHEGTYHVRIELEGYETQLLHNVKVRKNSPVKLSVEMKR